MFDNPDTGVDGVLTDLCIDIRTIAVKMATTTYKRLVGLKSGI